MAWPMEMSEGGGQLSLGHASSTFALDVGAASAKDIQLRPEIPTAWEQVKSRKPWA